MDTKPTLEAENGEEDAKQQCAICIHDIAPGSEAQLLPCLHFYCISCIQSWAKTKLSCPLCNGSFSSAKHFKDPKEKHQFELIAFNEPLPQEPTRDLSCLDFDFFLSLAARVHANIKDAESTLFTSNGVFSARGGVSSNTARTILHLYRSRIDEILASLLEENHFSAEVLLDEITLIDKNMQTLWIGQIPSGVLPTEEEEGYDDDDDLDEDAEFYRYTRDRPVEHVKRLPASMFRGKR